MPRNAYLGMEYGLNYSVAHEEEQKSFFYILVHISGTNCPVIMLQVPL